MKHFTNLVLYQLIYKVFLCQFAFSVCFWPAFSQLPDAFQRVELAGGLTNSVNFEFAPDGRIFIVDRYGELLIYKPDQQLTISAGTIQVFHDLEDGLLGIEFDPNFLSNNHIYLHYSPLFSSVNRVSRFTMNGDVLNLSSEIIMLEWPTQREICCHAAGDLAFDSQGNLFIATGDNTNHSLYATLNETDSNFSSENSSSNTNDLRGKILRITPQPDGSYTVPTGNLFSGGGGLSEIYVMGARNPYKIFVDKENTDWLFWGEVGPDANVPGPEGPVGYDEINLTKNAGNYGWPYLSGKNEAYLNDYANPPFYYDPAAPVNISIWNTGATSLPPAQPAWIDLFHESYLAGPRYYFDPAILDQQKLPIEFDEAFFYYDFNTSQIWVVKMDAQGNILSNEILSPTVFPVDEAGFIDMKIGPDGHMYILEYGAGCCPDNVGTGKLVRVDYIGIVTNSSPVVVLTPDPDNGSLPLNVNFSSTGTFDPDGDPLTYEWDFDGDGTFDSNLENPTFNYTVGGQYNVQLRVSDDQGGMSTSNTTIHAGNNATSFNFISPPDGGLIGWNDEISFEVTASDLEDGTIDCSNLNVVPSIGHLNHFHDDLTIDGCLKDITLDPLDHNIYGEMDIFYVLGVNYTDQGGLAAFDQIRLHPKLKEAEFYDSQNGIAEISNNDPWGGGNGAIRVNHDSYISFEGRNLLGISSVKYRVASAGVGGTIELRLDDSTGTLLSTTTVTPTGAWNSWTEVESAIIDPGGKHDLYFVFKNNPGESDLFNLNWVEFAGNGASTDNTPPEVVEVIASDLTTVNVEFSEVVSQSTAENVGNYQIDNGVVVASASLQEDYRTVVLTTNQIAQGQTYNLTITGVQNESGIAIIPGSHTFSLFESIRINAGGPQVNAGGNIFSADQFSTGGAVFENVVNINNTTDDALYQSERWGDLTYAIPVSSQGAYDVRLHFAEIFLGVDIAGGIGDRVFNVSIEGNQVLSNFDILTEVGTATALVKEINDVIVNDGVLTIQFTGVVENPKISAIEILDPNTFVATPKITVLSPADGADVNQPFQVGFSVENWEVAEGSTHMHYFIDGLMIGPHYSLNPITIDGLSLGVHTVRLELFESSHTGTGIFDEVTVNVTDQLVCSTTPFPDQWEEHLIDGALPYRSVYILPQQDIDGDGLKDIVTGAWWYKNPGSAAGNWVQNVIGSPFNNVTWIYDFDGDGDQDLFGTQGQYESLDLVWAENDGSGSFTIHSNLPSGTSSHDEIFIAGIAGGVFQSGGPYQMAITWNGAENGSSEVQMVTVPSDPVNGTWTIESIHPTSIGEGLSAGDIDDDGDLDLFQAGNWLRNDTGTWTLFSTGITFNTLFDRNRLSDFDQDGDLDGVAGQIGNNQEVAWLEAPEDPTQTWTKHTVDLLIDGTLSLGVADMDFDGDDDLIVGEFQGSHKLFGFENDLCNSGTWIKHIIDAGGNGLDHHDGSQLVDIDNDGDLDIITLGWNNITPRIFENLSGPLIVNLPPVLTDPSDQSYQPGALVNFQINGADPNPGDLLTYSASGLPGDLNIDGATGLITGILTAPVGDYSIVVRLSDPDGLFDETSFTITILNNGGNTAPILTNPGTRIFNGGSVSLQIDGSDLNSGDILTYSASGLPADLTIDASTGLISGALSAPAGDYNVTVRVEDQAGLFDEEIFTITITSFANLLRINSGGPSYTFGSEDWIADQNFTGGLIFGTTAAISSTANDALYQTERYADAGTMSYEIPLPPGDYQVRLHFAEIFYTSAGARIFDVDIEGGQGQLSNYDIFIRAGDANTAVVETFIITVNDGGLSIAFSSQVESAKISGIEINGVGNSTPVVTNPGSQIYNIGATVNLQLEGSDLNSGDLLTYSATGLPAGLDIEASTGLISGILSAPEGDYSVAVRLEDQDGLFDEETFIISISSVTSLLRINSGGPSFTFGSEDWIADQHFTGGLTFSTTAAISGTTNDALYQTERYADAGTLSYEIPLPTGSYQLRLHFAEIFHASAGSRIFDVDIESGQHQLNNYDIFVASGGANAAVVESFAVTVNDGGLSIVFTSQVESAKISGIEINGVGNVAPVVTNPGTQVYNGGSNVNLPIEGSDLNTGDILTYSVMGLPAGLGIEASTGLISGILSAPEGDYSVTVRLEDQDGLFDEETFTISISSVNSLLRINSGGPSITFGSEDWIADQNFTGGLTFSTTAAISSTTKDALYQTERYADAGTMSYEMPLPPGSYQLRLHFAEIFHTSAGSRIFDVDIESGQHQLNNYDIFVASGGANTAVVETFTVTVNDGGLSIAFTSQVESAKISGIEINGNSTNNPPVIDPIAVQTLLEGSNLEVQVNVQDPDGDFAVLSVNSLPLFASFSDHMDGTGTVFLAPGFFDAGTYNITVTATDNGGLMDSETITIEVLDENDGPPDLTAIDDLEILEGEVLNIALSATDPEGAIPIITIQGQPSFVSLVDNQDGTANLLISPGFQDVGLYEIKVYANDPDGFVDEEIFMLTVIAANGLPDLSVQKSITLTEGASTEIPVSSTDPDGEVPILTALNLPPFASFVDNGDGTGLLIISSGFNDFGVYDFIVKGTDSSGASTEVNVSLNVVEQTETPGWTVTVETTNANCLNENGSILLNVTGGFGEISYLWSNGEATRDLSNLSSGLYTVSITDQKNNNVTESFTINLQPGPQKPTILREGDILTAEETAFSYQWFFNGIEIQGATAKSLEVSLAGEYSVETGDLLGCLSNSDPIEIEYELSTLSFYPNPSKGSLNMEIVLVEDELITFILVDEIGRDSPLGIFDLKAGRHSIQLELDDNLANGSYTMLTNGKSFESNVFRVLLLK